MQTTLAFLALAAAGIVSAQGVTSVVSPTASAPAGCSTNYAGTFEITVVTPSKRDVEKRQSATCSASGTLVAKLSNGVLTDSMGRIGSIVANHQFQFDGPPAQAGAIYTGGWSVCNNGSLALGGSAVFYQCVSSNFYNLYDTNVQSLGTGNMCMPVLIDVIPCSAASSSGVPVSQKTDGQPTGVSASVVSQKTDGQPNAASATRVVSQISDGQPQAQSALPVSQFTDGQLQVTATPKPASAVTMAPVSQFTDGQIQATSVATLPKSSTAAAAPVSQFTDGQVQVTSVATMKTSASTAKVSVTTAKASLSSAVPVAQITDGQIQNSNATAKATSTYTGAAGMATFAAELGMAAIGIAAYALL